jgi:hypothetical protein
LTSGLEGGMDVWEQCVKEKVYIRKKGTQEIAKKIKGTAS